MLTLSGNISQGAEENAATALEAPTVEIIGTTPLPGIGVSFLFSFFLGAHAPP
jgi:hypothetical protein